jgi:hypothetical protein
VAHLEDKLKRRELDVVWAAYQRNKDEVKPQPLTSAHQLHSVSSSLMRARLSLCPGVSLRIGDGGGAGGTTGPAGKAGGTAKQVTGPETRGTKQSCICIYIMCIAETQDTPDSTQVA